MIATGLLALTVLMLPACLISSESSGSTALPPPREIVDRTYLYEVSRYLYRWQLDQAEVERLVDQKKIVFWIRRLNARLDPGDQSIVGEIVVPQLDFTIHVKKADYKIDELNLSVKNDTFKISEVTRGGTPAHPAPGAVVVELDENDVRDYLFKTRFDNDYPDAVLLEHLRDAFRKEISREGEPNVAIPTTEQIIHLAPLSPIANEEWVYWEGGQRLLYFSSDIDLTNPAMWTHETLMVRVFDLRRQVVVSEEEAPESNDFLTREQVGRTIFNCLVLGQRTNVMPQASAATQPAR
jgi:hypothetical protein